MRQLRASAQHSAWCGLSPCLRNRRGPCAKTSSAKSRTRGVGQSLQGLMGSHSQDYKTDSKVHLGS